MAAPPAPPAPPAAAAEPSGRSDFDKRFRSSVDFRGLMIHQEPAQSIDNETLDTGCTVWNASKVAAEFVMDAPALVKGAHVLELGAGTGLAGLACAAAGAARVVLSDMPHRLPLLRKNIRANNWVSIFGACAVEAATLDWDGPLDEVTGVVDAQPLDLIVGADLIHEVEHTIGLAKVFRRLFEMRPRAQLLWVQEAHNAMAVASLRRALVESVGLELEQRGSFGARGTVTVGRLR